MAASLSFVAAAPAQDDAEPAQLLEDFVHYVRIARVDLARKDLEAARAKSQAYAEKVAAKKVPF